MGSYKSQEILSLADIAPIVSSALSQVNSPEEMEARMLTEAGRATREWDAINLFNVAWECKQYRGKGAEFQGVV